MRSNAAQKCTDWDYDQPTVALDDVRTQAVTLSRPVMSRTSADSTPEWLESVLEKIEELANLKQNWDGRQSAAVRHDALMFAYSLLARSMLPRTLSPSIIPLGNGGVQLVWANAAAEVEVEVVQPNHVFVYHHNRQTDDEDEWEANTEFSKLASILKAAFTH